MNRRVLVVSSTFPQYEQDPRGRFLCRHWEREQQASGAHVRVLAPRTRWVDGTLRSPLDIVRFDYAPRAWASLTGRFGMLENLRERPLRAGLVPLYWRAQARAIERQLNSFAPDLVAAHMLLPCGWAVARACRRAGVPYELYGHGSDVDLLLTLARARRRAVLDMLMAAQRVMLPSHEKLARVQAVFGDEARQCRLGVETMAHVVDVAPVGDRSAVRCDTIDSASYPPRLLFMGRLIRQKGVDTLLRAVAELGPTVVIDIAGDGPQRRALERLARRLGVDARFLGYVQGSDHVEAYRRAAVLCVPSRELGSFSEGAPLVVLEARSHGVPVVATRVGGIPELCADDPNATLVPPDDVLALARALASVLARRGNAVVPRARADDVSPGYAA